MTATNPDSDANTLQADEKKTVPKPNVFEYNEVSSDKNALVSPPAKQVELINSDLKAPSTSKYQSESLNQQEKQKDASDFLKDISAQKDSEKVVVEEDDGSDEPFKKWDVTPRAAGMI